MNTQCTAEQMEFHGLGRRRVVGRFDGGRMSSDGGGVLLREADLRLGLTQRLAGCFSDYRNPGGVEHSVRELLAQRIYAIALGYEDLNDHDVLSSDSLLALLVGKRDVTGGDRPRERDRDRPLASSSTLNRLELGQPAEAGADRYKRIVVDTEALDRLLAEVFMESFDSAPREVWLDLDATDDPLHGDQEGRFFHGYYRCYCYLPLYVFCGEHLLCARLRTSGRDGAAGSVEELQPIVERLRRRWPKTRIRLRGDSGFCREELMSWCEREGLGYVFGLARNVRLVEEVEEAMSEARKAHGHTKRASRRFVEFAYRTRKSWSRERRVVGKAEYLSKGPNPRFVVTNLPRRQAGARRLYEQLYCARGEMENRIKEQQRGDLQGQSTALVLRLVRLPADARGAPAGNERHPLRPRPMHHSAACAAEDRRADQGHGAPGVAVVRPVVCVCANLSAGAGQPATLSGVAARPDNSSTSLPDRRSASRRGVRSPGGRTIPDPAGGNHPIDAFDPEKPCRRTAHHPKTQGDYIQSYPTAFISPSNRLSC